jgi:hypothetical protein
MCEAWNGEDRDFIHQLKIEDGEGVVRKLSDAVTQQGVILAKDIPASELISGFATQRN